MSSKVVQLSPNPSTRAIRLTLIPEEWMPSLSRDGFFADGSLPDGLQREKSFLQSWFERNSGENSPVAGKNPGINWGAICGMALAVAVSAAFWAGVGLIIERIWK